ncbi:MAG: DUF5916 domain-containing protein [bacterium]
MKKETRLAARLLIFYLGCALLPKAARAQGPLTADDPIDPLSIPRPSLRAYHTEDTIVLDGRLDEPAWQEADSTDGIFWQAIPRQGMPSTERTVIRILYDAKKIYIGARLYDSEPDKLIAAGLEQDFRTQDSDILGIALDTYWDKQNSFLFAINPAGAIFDAQAFNDQAYVNRAWEGIVEVKTSLFKQGWIVEMAIPTTTLRFNQTEGEQTWGLNFSRRIRRRSEDSNWAPLPRQFRLYKMSQAGTLTGLYNLKQGRNLWIKPYGSAARRDGSVLTGGHAENDVDGGFDIKWGVTPQLTLDATTFTDFSQVEVDQQQVNLTRFSLFFPERRDFFLENDGVFTFSDVRVRNYRTGSGPQNFKLFHSRKIGLSDDRLPVTIVAGARLTGRAGNFDLGLLNMQTRRDGDSPAENFTVARLRRNILKSSDVGIMFTNRQRTDSVDGIRYNRTIGVDGNVRILGNMLVNTYFAASDEPGRTGERTAAALQVAWRDPLWDASFLLKTVGEDFNPGIGFVSRKGIRQGFATVGAHPQPGIPKVFELNPYIDVNFFSDPDWTLESREIKPGFGLRFLNSSVLTLQYSARLERLIVPTTIAGVQVPIGEYNFNSATISYRSDSGRRMSWNASFTKGDFFDGNRTSVSGGLAIRPSPKWYLQTTFQANRLELGGQSLDANLFGGRLYYNHNTRTFFSVFIQVNQAADELISNLRFNLIHAPLSDIFLVYQERRDLDPDPGEGAILDRMLTLKVTKLFAF